MPVSTEAVPFTVGKIEEGIAILVSDDLQLVEFPTDCLPTRAGPIGIGSVLSLQLDHSLATETARRDDFLRLQKDILGKYGVPPDGLVFSQEMLREETLGHECIVVGWTSWAELRRQHGWHAKLLSLDCYLNDTAIFTGIDEAETAVRLSGLEADRPFTVQLLFRTTAGNFRTNTLALRTPQATDMAGIHLLLVFSEENGDDDETLLACQALGCTILNPGGELSEGVRVEQATHVVARSLSEVDTAMLGKIRELQVPLVTPEWAQACQVAGKLVPTAEYRRPE